MLNLINRARVFSHAKLYKLQINCKDKPRSKIDLLYRFIAQLNLSHFNIEKVDIWEDSCTGEITFSEVPRDKIGGSRMAYLFKRQRAKAELRFKVNLTVIQLDRLGWNFHIDYYFEDRLQSAAGSQKIRLNEQIHLMMETAFVGNPNILISPVLNFET